MTPPLFDSRQVRRAFGRAASDYSAVAVLQREVEDRLLEQLDYLEQPPARVLDLGCGPGRGTALIEKRWPKALVVGLDQALPMLRQRRGGWLKKPVAVAADAQQLPLADGSFDLIVSSLCLQWVDDLPATLAGIARVLRPGGLLLFSTFAESTLVELREAFAAADPGQPHVSPFLPVQAIGDAVLGAGFRDPVVDVDRFTLTYGDPGTVMRELRTIGAGNALAGRRRSLTGKARMQRVFAGYEALRRDGRLPATWEVAYVQAWGLPAGQPRREGGAEIASFPVERLRIRRRDD